MKAFLGGVLLTGAIYSLSVFDMTPVLLENLRLYIGIGIVVAYFPIGVLVGKVGFKVWGVPYRNDERIFDAIAMTLAWPLFVVGLIGYALWHFGFEPIFYRIVGFMVGKKLEFRE